LIEKRKVRPLCQKLCGGRASLGIFTEKATKSADCLDELRKVYFFEKKT